MVAKELTGMNKGDVGEGGEDETAEPEEPEEMDDDDMEPDEEGVMKCMSNPKAPWRARYKKAIKRFSMKEIKGAKTCPTGDTPEDEMRLKRAQKKFKKASTLYG